MKKTGLIISYDSYNGKIQDTDGNIYELYKKNTLEDIKQGDQVIFDVINYDGVEVKKLIAMFVKKIKN